MDYDNILDTREEISIMPSLADYEILAEKNSTSMVLKDKLLMRPGEHNGVNYSYDDLKSAAETGEEAGLFYDHDDSCSNYVGFVKNIHGVDSTEEIRGDLFFLDESAFNKVDKGAKWGLSPTIDAEKVIKDGKKFAIDSKFISFSLVLRPAVRETMLNSEIQNKQPQERKMGEETREIEELARKQIDELKEKLKKTEEELAKYRVAELERQCSSMLDLEESIGFISKAERTERIAELKSMSDAERFQVKKVHERYMKTLGLKEDVEESEEENSEDVMKENYIAFRAKFLKANPDASEADVKKAYANLAQKKKYPYPYPAKKEKLGHEVKEAQERMKEELSEVSARQDVINREFLSYMEEQERK